MHAACSWCGHEPAPGAVYLQEPRRPGADVAKIRREARKAGGELGELLDLVADRLETEDAAVDGFEDALRRAYEGTVEVLAASRDHRALAILAANEQGLGDLLEATGILKGRVALSAELQQLIQTARASATVQGLPAGIVKLDVPALRALIDPRDPSFWDAKIKAPAISIIRDGAARALALEPLSKTVDEIARKLDKSVGRATGIARTEIAVFDRVVNHQVAEAAGLQQWLYLGPVDGLTRPFCRALANKVVDAEQMASLDNGHGIGSPLVSGGGHGCRHRTVAVSDGFVERRSLTRATAADVDAANAAGTRA